MFGNERKTKITLVAEKEEMMYAKLLQGYVSSKDDEGDENIVGVQDGTVETVLWLFNEKEGNRPTMSSEQKMICFGKNKMTQDEIAIIEEKFSEMGMYFGWLGNTAVIYIDKKPMSVSDYVLFRTRAKRLDLTLSGWKKRMNLKKHFQKGKI